MPTTGHQLGQFIAGIRNSGTGECVHELAGGWKYASRAGVWEDNDPSLGISCYRDAPQSQPQSPAQDIHDVVDQVVATSTTTNRPHRPSKLRDKGHL